MWSAAPSFWSTSNFGDLEPLSASWRWALSLLEQPKTNPRRGSPLWPQCWYRWSDLSSWCPRGKRPISYPGKATYWGTPSHKNIPTPDIFNPVKIIQPGHWFLSPFFPQIRSLFQANHSHSDLSPYSCDTCSGSVRTCIAFAWVWWVMTPAHCSQKYLFFLGGSWAQNYLQRGAC